MLTSWFVKFQW